jgi:hypothetical protein
VHARRSFKMSSRYSNVARWVRPKIPRGSLCRLPLILLLNLTSTSGFVLLANLNRTLNRSLTTF